MEQPVLLLIGEVAKLCRVHKRTVERWIYEGRLPVVRLGERNVRVRRDVVEKVLETGNAGEGAR